MTIDVVSAAVVTNQKSYWNTQMGHAHLYKSRPKKKLSTQRSFLIAVWVEMTAALFYWAK